MSTTMNALEVAILGNISKTEGFDYVFENVQSVADLKACAALPDEELAHMFKGGTVEAVQRLRGREYMQIAYWYDKHSGQYYTSGILPARPKIIFESLIHFEHENDTWNGIKDNCDLHNYLKQSIQPVADQWIDTNKQWKQESQAYEVNEALRDFFYFDDLDDYIARYNVAALRDARMTCNIWH